MDSTAQTTRAALETFNETASTGDAWIRQRKLPMGPQKSSTKLLPQVTHAFDSANSPCGLRNHQRNRVTGDSKIINETASTGDACIRQRKQPLRPQKSSRKLIPLGTHAFDSANSPCALEIFNETASTGDAWIRPRKQPVRP